MKHSELRQEWEQRLAEFSASGQTAKAWCEQNQIKPHQFFYWQRRLRSVESDAASQPVRWMSLDYDFQPTTLETGSKISVQIGRASIQIEKGFDPDLLLEVARLLQDL